jgi:hypothetical protein
MARFVQTLKLGELTLSDVTIGSFRYYKGFYGLGVNKVPQDYFLLGVESLFCAISSPDNIYFLPDFVFVRIDSGTSDLGNRAPFFPNEAFRFSALFNPSSVPSSYVPVGSYNITSGNGFSVALDCVYKVDSLISLVVTSVNLNVVNLYWESIF